MAPAVSLYERHSLRGLWNNPQGPWQYVASNWFTGIQQFGISGLLSTTPYGRRGIGGSAFDGSLWSLPYELSCYVVIGILAVTAILRRAPRIVLLLTLITYGFIVSDLVGQAGWTPRPVDRGLVGPIPGVGSVNVQLLVYLGFLFLLGSVAQLYKDRLPMHPALAAMAAAAVLLSALFGGFFVIGLPCYAYVLLWAACVLPRALHGIGRRHDYSYGVYIYAFPVQQIVALVGGVRYGVFGFILLSAFGTAACAVLSWHLVERPAMSLKDWAPTLRQPVAPAAGRPS
jgi:peptidoglycan/LPS O-acetylase OafA/YrhL